MQPAAKLRALFALKNVLRALKSKRFVVEAPEAVAGLSQAGILPAAPMIAVVGMTGQFC